jgi:membrane protein DedA with SNARE-associated domain
MPTIFLTITASGLFGYAIGYGIGRLKGQP